MNTTNLITDYIIAGILGVLTLLVPYLLLESHMVKMLFITEFKNSTIFAVLITATGYSFGVVFNQFADYIEEKIFFVLRNKDVEKSERNLQEVLGFNHHYALQLIVAKSQSAYDYISFRRTMIRIMRSFFVFAFISPLVHLAYSIIYRFYGYDLYFSFNNLLIIISSFLLGFFIFRNLKRLYRGYYGALINFAIILTDKEL